MTVQISHKKIQYELLHTLRERTSYSLQKICVNLRNLRLKTP